MKGLVDFIKTTVLGGIVVVLPVVLVVFLLAQAIDVIGGLVAPLADKLPSKTLGGIGTATFLAIFAVLGICFVMGLLIHTRIGALTRDWFEAKLLNRLPGYTMIKNLTQRFSGIEGTEFAPALADLYGSNTQALSLIVEEHEDGNYTVFVPLAPTPTIGQVYLLPQERVHRINAPLSRFVNSIMEWGVNSQGLFQPQSELEDSSRDQ